MYLYVTVLLTCLVTYNTRPPTIDAGPTVTATVTPLGHALFRTDRSSELSKKQRVK